MTFAKAVQEIQNVDVHQASDRSSGQQSKPIRILHSVGHLSRGGIETWLYQTITRMDPGRYEHHVLVLTDEDEPFTQTYRNAHISVLPCPSVRQPHLFLKNFQRIIKKHGPFDVIHAHGISMLTTQSLLFGFLNGIPARTLHAHNDLRPRLKGASLAYRTYIKATLVVCRALANVSIACGEKAGEWTFGDGWRDRKPPVEMLIGVDLEPCVRPRTEPRSEALKVFHGIPLGRPVLVQVGRFTVTKNHKFTVEIASEMHRRNFPFHLLLIGDGPLRGAVRQELEARGLAGQVTWIPDSSEVPDLLVNVSDLLLLPSLHEGLPLVPVEAQAAGLPVLVSEHVARECALPEGNVSFLPIGDGADPWCDRIEELLHSSSRSDMPRRRATLASRFHIDHSVQQLAAVYDQLPRRSHA